jgi:hypothetical protein
VHQISLHREAVINAKRLMPYFSPNLPTQIRRLKGSCHILHQHKEKDLLRTTTIENIPELSLD